MSLTLYCDKLKTIQYWPYSIRNTRREELGLSRQQIGHVRLTCEYLIMKKNYIEPTCKTSNAELTIKHILI